MKKYYYKGIETQYYISEDGQLFNSITNNYPKGWVCKIGYKMYYVNIQGKKMQLYAHRMVAETYLLNEENKECVNHIDGNKLNNHYLNLEWVTKKENNNHAVETGLNPLYKKTYCYDLNKNLITIYNSLNEAALARNLVPESISRAAKAILKPIYGNCYWSFEELNDFNTVSFINNGNKKSVAQYDLNDNLIETFSSIKEAHEITGISRRKISDCARGILENYKGYKWKFCNKI